MSTPSFTTQISSSLASSISKALVETGDDQAVEDFYGAVAWPITPMAKRMLEIRVSPKVTAAMLSLVNGGQLAALVGSGVSSQEVLALATTWQHQLSNPPAPEARQ